LVEHMKFLTSNTRFESTGSSDQSDRGRIAMESQGRSSRRVGTLSWD
jgi:hypothetical protein